MAKPTTNKGGRAPAKASKAATKTAAPAPAQPTAQAAKPTTPALPWVGVQNGVQPPKRAGLCSAVWELTTAGMVQGTAGNPPTPPPLATVKAQAAEQGLNPTNVSIEYYRCRQWHGVRGRVAKGAQA